MFQIIIGTIIGFLAVAGLVGLARAAQELLYAPGKKVTLMVTSRGHDEKIEYIIRSLVFRAESFYLKNSPVIIIVDEGMDDETRDICLKLSKEFSFINICAPQELPKLLCSDNL